MKATLAALLTLLATASAMRAQPPSQTPVQDLAHPQNTNAGIYAFTSRCASCHDSGRGALVVLNDEINAAREATKTDALRLNTFQTRGYGLLGVVDADRVVFYRSSLKRHT